MQVGSTPGSDGWLGRIATRVARRWWVVALVIAMTTAVHAQNPDAEALFREAKKLMNQGSYATACEKFEASERLEAKIGTELNLADCREKAGQLATAWAMFIRVMQSAKHSGDPRAAEAKHRADRLERRLVYLTVAVPRPARVAGLVVHRNDTVVDAAAYNQAVPVDPDRYAITAEAPGYEPWRTEIAVGNTNKIVEVPPLRKAPPPAAPPAAAAASDAAPPPPRPSSWTPRRKQAAALGAVGVAAGVTGIVLGVHANSLENSSDAICKTTRCSDPMAIDLNSSARRDGLIANLCMIGGGAMAASAVALWILGGKQPHDHDDVSIVPRISPSGIALEGRF